MKKKLINYISYLEEIHTENMEREEKAALKKEVLVKIGFFQHERLIHLIVTVTFAVLFILSVFLFFYIGLLAFVISGAILVLLIPYIGHYYTLENGVQKLYELYDKIGY